MKKAVQYLILPFLLVSCQTTTSTCEECGNYFEYTYTDTITISNHAGQTFIIIEQPYADWDNSGIDSPEIEYTEHSSGESVINVTLTVEAGSYKEGYKTEVATVQSDDESHFIWYGSVEEQYTAKQGTAAIPRPQYFRITNIEIGLPESTAIEAEFRVRY